MRDWPQEFEDVLLPHLPDHDATEPLDPDAPLGDAGLTSLAVVGLMVDLENAFDFEFEEDRVTADTFYSPQSLWTVVAEHRAADPLPTG
ncbi:acyl carrier protein [Plantactinospora sp. S1510]|uniref:Acyl carrier protein n=1 Tax=Plantactinospora alkalitolerans TaxID=2789879 RepID=A0ABS0H2W8_9ACTN|nr:phosphopantetheine-binding protein [Plantactinospora alkalitolerans]MBF9132808.1 acyl carrier protein [Plantactinospora alkalitolerans]